MIKRNPDFINKHQQIILIAVTVLIVLAVSLQSFLLEKKPEIPGGIHYTYYNNYLIFKQSFFQLIGNHDLYELSPEKHYDYYKYSPTFALLMAPLAILPDFFGLFAWNLLNALVLVFALWNLPFQNNKFKWLALAFITIELITSLQNSQSNALMAGLIIYAFIFLEKKKPAIAALFIMLTVFIKIFGLVALSLFVLYNKKPKAALYVIIWAVVLGLLPLLVISPAQLILLYASWFKLLAADQSISLGLSVMGWLSSWFHLEISKNVIVLMGALVFCLPFIRYRQFDQLQFRLFFLASLLIWMIIFNHKAESPTFIIAVSGVAIWFFTQKYKPINLALLLFSLLFTILSPTDLFPMSIRDNYVIPYVLKSVPCILIWFKIIFDLTTWKRNELI